MNKIDKVLAFLLEQEIRRIIHNTYSYPASATEILNRNPNESIEEALELIEQLKEE